MLEPAQGSGAWRPAGRRRAAFLNAFSARPPASSRTQARTGALAGALAGAPDA